MLGGVLYSCSFHEKIIKFWYLPGSEENAVQLFQSYRIIPSHKQCISGHCMSNTLSKRIPIQKETWFDESRIYFVTAVRILQLVLRITIETTLHSFGLPNVIFPSNFI